MVINQGDVYWVDLGVASGSGPSGRRPCVVIQNNVFNHSRIATVVLCVLTSNLRRAASPGNVLLNHGEANLPKQSVVNVSQVITVDKTLLEEHIGVLSARRVSTVLRGVHLVLQPSERP
jgi:mRNA interferase MazF